MTFFLLFVHPLIIETPPRRANASRLLGSVEPSCTKQCTLTAGIEFLQPGRKYKLRLGTAHGACVGQCTGFLAVPSRGMLVLLNRRSIFAFRNGMGSRGSSCPAHEIICRHVVTLQPPSAPAAYLLPKTHPSELQEFYREPPTTFPSNLFKTFEGVVAGGTSLMRLSAAPPYVSSKCSRGGEFNCSRCVSLDTGSCWPAKSKTTIGLTPVATTAMIAVFHVLG